MPPPLLGRLAWLLVSCRINHKPSTSAAGTRTILINIQIGMSMSIDARGYKSKYAPSTPEIAPLAPTIGMGDEGTVKA